MARDAAPPTVGGLDPASRRELWGWLVVAIGALAVAGAFALLLAVSRIPGIDAALPWPVDFFHKGLVIHVVFSFVVWFLAVFGAMLLVGVRPADPPRWFRISGRVAVIGTAAATPLLFVPALLDSGEATLNDYVPVIIDPLYYAGLVLMAAAVAVAAWRALWTVASGRAAQGAFSAQMAAAAGIFALAVVCFGTAYALLSGEPLSHSFNQELFWGGGHVLQFLNTLLLIAAWWLLADHVEGARPRPSWPILAATVLVVLIALMAPVLYVVTQPFSAEQTQAFTDLQYGLAPPVLIAAAIVAWRLPRPLPWREPAFLCIALSMVVFGVGGAFGLFVDGADTRTPAHYHGVIAGVTLGFMGLFYAVFLPALEHAVRRGRSLYSQIYLFGGGQLAACVGLFLAGGFGAPRKTAGAAQGLVDLEAVVGMALNGAGALVAVVGGVLFIWTAGSALLQGGREVDRPAGSPSRLA